jgi:hypothetical protein
VPNNVGCGGYGRPLCDDVSVRWIKSSCLIAGLAFLAGCSAAPSTSLGELTGGVYICGGVSDHGCPGVIINGGPARPISGTVIVSESGRSVAKMQLNNGQSYRFALPPGTYTVSAGSHFPEVRAAVKASNTTTANLVEQIP